MVRDGIGLPSRRSGELDSEETAQGLEQCLRPPPLRLELAVEPSSGLPRKERMNTSSRLDVVGDPRPLGAAVGGPRRLKGKTLGEAT